MQEAAESKGRGEIARRIAAMYAGETKFVSSEVVVAKIDAKLRSAKKLNDKTG